MIGETSAQDLARQQITAAFAADWSALERLYADDVRYRDPDTRLSSRAAVLDHLRGQADASAPQPSSGSLPRPERGSGPRSCARRTAGTTENAEDARAGYAAFIIACVGASGTRFLSLVLSGHQPGRRSRPGTGGSGNDARIRPRPPFKTITADEHAGVETGLARNGSYLGATSLRSPDNSKW